MATISVWPRPAEVTAAETVVWLAPATPVEITWSIHARNRDPGGTSWTEDLRTKFHQILFQHALMPEKFHPFNHKFEPDVSSERICVRGVTMNIVDSSQDESEEQYELHLTAHRTEAHLSLTINSFAGGHYALQTLRQLFYKHGDLQETILYTLSAPFQIKDKPRFAHRGLNLDISRNRIGPEAVIRTIEGLASSKLNRLHLHATDSQSWPLEIPALPELAHKGAYHYSQIWTAADLERVQQYGQDRGVQVFLEIDMPGHTGSIHHSHPELIVGYDQRPWQPYAAQPPSGQLKLNNPQVIGLLEMLLDDLLPRCVKYSKYFHVGADEINAKVYELDPGVQSSDTEVIRPILQAFMDIAMAKIIDAGLVPIAWEELLLDWDIDLPESTIIQVWRSHENLSKVMARGHKAIFGPSTHWYLDGGQGGWMDPDPANNDSQVEPPYLDWIDPYKNWRQVCSYDPFEGVQSEYHHLLLGGEVSLWCELTDEVTLDSKLWPRVAAAAETLWAGPQEVNEKTTRRLAEFRERLVLQGIGAGVVQMEWALRNAGGSLA